MCRAAQGNGLYQQEIISGIDCRKQEVNSTKTVFIAEKPSVARSFASALGKNFRNADGYMEADDAIVTWCVGHLVSMSYPDAYDASLKKWSMATIPFIPEKYKYQVKYYTLSLG